METTKTAPPRNSTHKDVYTIINERIIEQLEKGTVPWCKPWITGGCPKNLVTQRQYRGINIMLLTMLGYEHNLFVTTKQLDNIGGSVKQGEKGHMVVLWNYPEKQEDEDPSKTKKWEKPVLRYYTVYNLDQCNGIPKELMPEPAREIQAIPVCQYVHDHMPQRPRIQFKEAKAYYDPLRDFVNMPKQKTFVSDEAYYSVLFHELIHSTGHHSRLNRKDIAQMSEFGSESYSQEELVAEIGTCYLQSYCGIEGEFERSTAYIQGWLAKLKNDKRFIFSASTNAQKAVDFILNMQNPEEKIEE